MSRRIVVSTFAALCLLALGLMVPSRTVHGQTFRGAILGTVNDSSEAPVPGTQVTVKNLKIIKIGDSHRCDYGAKWGAIGVYDRTNLNHLNSMVHAAREATRDRGSLIKDD